MAWALFNAESDNNGKVETWESHGLSEQSKNGLCQPQLVKAENGGRE